MLNDFNFIKIYHNSLSLKEVEFDLHFFLCNIHSFKIAYKDHSSTARGILSFWVFAYPIHTLVYPILFEEKFLFCLFKVKAWSQVQKSSDTQFSQDVICPKYQFDVNLHTVCPPRQYTCFKIHVRIKLLPIFFSSAKWLPSTVQVLIICTVFTELPKWQVLNLQLLQFLFALVICTFYYGKDHQA